MAKKDKEDSTPSFDSLSERDQRALIGKAFDTLAEFSTQCTLLENAQSNIDSFEDTGCYILNALLSGNLNGGFPEGRMSVLAAPSSVGKSYIGLQTAAIAQKKGKYVVIFDSEFAIDKEFAKNMGLDISRVQYFPVKSVEQCKNAIFKFLNFVLEHKMDGQFFILIDSLGAMISEMDYKRLQKDSDAADMGTAAKAMKQLIKVCCTMSGQTNTTIVCTNHIYDDPNQLYSPIGGEKPMPGGRAVRYLPSTIVQMSATNIKEGDDKRKIKDEAAVGSKDIIGIAVTGTSIKNRVCKPYMKADMYISWERGLSPYYGLFDLASDFGLLQNKGGRIYIAETNELIGFKADVIENAEFWNKFMPTLQLCIDKTWKYKSDADRKSAQAEEKAKEAEAMAEIE